MLNSAADPPPPPAQPGHKPKRPMILKTTFLLAAGGALLSAGLTAQAQSAPARVVTRDELRACMDSGDNIRARQQELDQRNKRAAEDLAAMRAEAAELAEDKKRLEDHPDQPRARFERRLLAYNAKLPAEKANADAFKADLEAFNTALATHNTQCGHIAASSTDREAVQKEREAKAKAK
jgi:predicted nuclease with TOPRIM domain